MALYVVDFGRDYQSLGASVQYAFYNSTGSQLTSPVNTGVFEFGTSGIYGVNATGPTDAALIRWNITGATGTYFAAEVLVPQLANITQIRGQSINGSGTPTNPWGP